MKNIYYFQFFTFFFVIICGFLLGSHPEASFVCFLIFGFLLILRHGLFWTLSDTLVCFYGAISMLSAIFSQGLFYISVIEVFSFLLFMRVGSILLKKYYKIFWVFATIGISMNIIFAANSAINPIGKHWRADTSSVIVNQINNEYVFTPIKLYNAYVTYPVGLQGPGEIKFEFDVRSDQPLKTFISFLHNGLENGRLNAECNSRNTWKRCSISAWLPSSGNLRVIFGGFGTWNKGSPDVHIKSSRFSYLRGNSILNQLRNIDRQSGWATDPNTFAAWVFVVSIVLIFSANTRLGIGYNILIMILGIYLSGSRSVMYFAILILFLIFLVAMRKYLTYTVVVSIVLVLGIVGIGNSFKLEITGFRAFNINDTSNLVSRTDIWGYALSEVKEHPIFGQGNRVSWKKPGDSKVIKSHAHNIFLQILLEGGLIKIGFFIFMMGTFTFKKFKEKNFNAVIFFWALILVNTFDYSFEFAPIKCCFWMIVGFSFNDNRLGQYVPSRFTI